MVGSESSDTDGTLRSRERTNWEGPERGVLSVSLVISVDLQGPDEADFKGVAGFLSWVRRGFPDVSGRTRRTTTTIGEEKRRRRTGRGKGPSGSIPTREQKKSVF